MTGSVDLSGYAALKTWAEMFYDVQQHRIRTENRLGSKEVLPEVFAPEVAAARATEHRIKLHLRRQFRQTAPFGVLEWVKSTKGIGIDSVARLVGHLGHPRIATPFHWEGSGSNRTLVADEPYERTVGELRAYCGHGDPDRKPFKNMTAADAAALGNPTLKKLVHVVADCAIRYKPDAHLPDPTNELTITRNGPLGRDLSAVDSHPTGDTHCSIVVDGDPFRDTHGWAGNHVDRGVAEPSPGTTTKLSAATKQPSWPYRAVYNNRRAETFDRVHDKPCVRCGPSGNPAEAGSPWSKTHQHADALRIVGKEILADLWKAAI